MPGASSAGTKGDSLAKLGVIRLPGIEIVSDAAGVRDEAVRLLPDTHPETSCSWLQQKCREVTFDNSHRRLLAGYVGQGHARC
jgi:hypothetical protein